MGSGGLGGTGTCPATLDVSNMLVNSPGCFGDTDAAGGAGVGGGAMGAAGVGFAR